MDYFLLTPVLMLALPYVAGRKCPMNDVPQQPAQPPSKVFGIVWPILYVLSAYSMYRLLKRSRSSTLSSLAIGLGVLALLANLCYIRVAGCKKDWRMALWVLVVYTGIVLTQMMATFAVDVVAGICLAPLVVWCIFAMQLNMHLVNSSEEMSLYNCLRPAP